MAAIYGEIKAGLRYSALDLRFYFATYVSMCIGRLIMTDNETSAAKQKTKRNGTLRKSDTLSFCLLIMQWWSGILITHGNRVWGDITSDERAVNGPGPG